MRRRKRFLVAAAGTFGFTLAGFLTLGFTRGFIGYETARLLATPFVLAAAVCAAYALVVSVLVTVGVIDLDA